MIYLFPRVVYDRTGLGPFIRGSRVKFRKAKRLLPGIWLGSGDWFLDNPAMFQTEPMASGKEVTK